jgi:hypothetical protein
VAGGLIGFVVVLVKSTKSSAKEDREPARTEQASSRDDKQTATQPKRKRPRTTDTKAKKQQQIDRKSDTEASARGPVRPREEQYDELLDDVGQFGERPARKGSQWGLWRKGKWIVLPVYDEIQVYKDGRARVSVNGNSYDLDANGDRIR